MDTLGWLLKVVAHPADLHDRLGAQLASPRAPGDDFARFQRIWADQGYADALRRWTAERLGIDMEVVYPRWRRLHRYMPNPLPTSSMSWAYSLAFTSCPDALEVERTLSWLGRSHRHSNDYERLPASSAALVYPSCIRLLLVHLA